MQFPNDSSAQVQSAAYRLPVEDTAFLLRDEMRATRFAMEYSKADLLLRDWGIRSTIIVFGSARVPSPEQAECLIEAARSSGDRDLLTVETSRGAEQTLSTAKYEVTGRGGKGRELLQRGQFTRVLWPTPDAPAPLTS